MTLGEPPPYAFELCPSCGRDVVLATHDLSCLQHDPRIRVAVAWICDDCNLVLGIVGLFTSWTAAIHAHQDELDQRAATYFNVASSGGADVPFVSTDRRRNIITESRRCGPI